MTVVLPALCLALSLGAPPIRGVALGLYSEDAGFSYAPLLREIAALGANQVELVINLYQQDGASVDLYAHTRFTPTDQAILRAAADARAVHLGVAILPIIRLEKPKEGEWRGSLHPRDPGAWWRSYTARMEHYARLSTKARATLFVVGSELATLDDASQLPRWRALATRVRRLFSGPLVYAGNYYTYKNVGIWDAVDRIALSAYFELAEAAQVGTSVDAMVGRWRPIRAALEALSRAHDGKKIVMAEVGYLSQRGAAAWPWKEWAHEPVDLEEQRRCYRAFITAWRDAPLLDGVFFWNWYGWGGPASRGYTPRGKPAAAEITRWFHTP